MLPFLERVLWNTRYMALIAVAACIAVALALTFIVSAEAVSVFSHLGDYLNPDIDSAKFYTALLARLTGVIDGYLFAVFMIIFGMGIYELFIGKIEIAESSPIAERILLIRSLDDLKDRLAKIVFLILIVKYFQYALDQHYDSPQALLSLAAGIVLIAAGIWLTSKSH